MGNIIEETLLFDKENEPNYIKLRKQVENLIIYQRQIEKRIKKIGKWSTGFRFKKFVYEKIFRRKQYTLEELFNIQLANIGCLNANLKSIILRSRKELERIEKYHSKLDEELISNLRNVKTEKNNLESKINDYKVMKESISAMKRNEDYFKKEKELKNLKRNISEKLHYYNLKSESIVDIINERRFLEKIEDLMRLSIQMCERIGAKVERMERHVNNTKRAYDSFKKQQITISSLCEAVYTLREFTIQIHKMLGEGLSTIAKIANESKMEDFYSINESRVENIIKEIIEANKVKNKKIEEAIKEYIT